MNLRDTIVSRCHSF